MENLEKIEKALKTANSIINGINNYRQTIKDSRCDKFGMGFNKDNRFSSAKITLSIDSWTGYYGNSGCSTFLSITDSGIFAKQFVEVLNDNFYTLMIETANRIKNDALKHRKDAERELSDKLEKIKSLGNEKESDIIPTTKKPKL